MDDAFRHAVLQAARRGDVRQAVQQVYDDVRQAIDARGPICAASGRCCRFEDYGHRLYVTTAELATFIHELPEALAPEPSQALSGWNGQGCCFQIANRCSVHAIRPFGCRMFYCDASAEQWQQENYAHFHTRLKQLHERLDVPYFYLEWRQALRILLLGEPTPDLGPAA